MFREFYESNALEHKVRGKIIVGVTGEVLKSYTIAESTRQVVRSTNIFCLVSVYVYTSGYSGQARLKGNGIYSP